MVGLGLGLGLGWLVRVIGALAVGLY